MPNNDELAIRKLIATWLDATRRADVETVLTLMTDDVVFLTPGQPPARGRDSFAAALRALLATHAIEALSEIEEIEVSGDLAYCRTKLTVEVTPRDGGGAAVRRGGQTLSILRRQADGRWLLTRDANLLGAPA